MVCEFCFRLDICIAPPVARESHAAEPPRLRKNPPEIRAGGVGPKWKSRILLRSQDGLSQNGYGQNSEGQQLRSQSYFADTSLRGLHETSSPSFAEGAERSAHGVNSGFCLDICIVPPVARESRAAETPRLRNNPTTIGWQAART
jgi:hypothetical protein